MARKKAKTTIMENDSPDFCYICGRYCPTEFHHIFYGKSNRKWSQKYKIKVHLCHWCHNEPPDGIHFNHENDTKLKQEAQRRAMEFYGWTTEDFRRIFGKNYL